MSQDYASAMPFSTLMGIQITHATSEEVRGELLVRPDLCTLGNILHGGAIMAFADALGAIGGFVSLPEGARATTTIESKTNFLGSAPEGSTIRGVTTSIKQGSRLSVWQTEVVREDGKKVALITQTQMVL